MILHKQPGCWLRSSHSFKECVIAHWSSEVARKITGAKLYTEIADLHLKDNVSGRGAFCSRMKHDRKDREGSSAWGKSGPKERPKGVSDG